MLWLRQRVNTPGIEKAVRLCCAALLVSVLAACAATGSGKTPQVPAVAQDTDGAHRTGKFVWLDLLTQNPKLAVDFYGALFGWQFEPYGDSGEYLVIWHAGRPFGGIVTLQQRPLEKQPSTWLPSLSVADVQVAADLTTARGGVVHDGPRKLPLRGEIAVVSDPDGAELVLLHADGGDPKELVPEVGGWAWTEQWSGDPQRALAFYSDLVGFTARPVELPTDFQYYELRRDGRARGGLAEAPGKDLPSLWVPYLWVNDVFAVTRQAKELGAKVLLAPGSQVSGGRAALLADPTGAVFGIQSPPSESSTQR